jgi:hypothetical protein
MMSLSELSRFESVLRKQSEKPINLTASPNMAMSPRDAQRDFSKQAVQRKMA